MSLDFVEKLMRCCLREGFRSSKRHNSKSLLDQGPIRPEEASIHVSNYLMKALSVVAVLMALLSTSFSMDKPSFHTQGTATGKPTGPLKPGEYWWKPQISPQGPVVVLVSIPQQTMHVYRNGILTVVPR